jgi:ribonuclease P protein component
MSARGRERFPKTARLRKRPEFLRLSRTGRKVHAAHFVVIIKSNGLAAARLGVTVSGKVGNSVVRNRIKRRVREYFRRRQEMLSGIDILIIARTSAADLSSRFIEVELDNSLLNQRSFRTS